MSQGITLGYVTFPSLDCAQNIIAVLLQKQLIACANIVGGGESHYMWEGKLCITPEVYVIFKLPVNNKQLFLDALVTLHPYDCPAILFVSVEGGHLPFIQWVQDLAPPPIDHR
jgi:periplasmic divalent cation tolerance protein